MRTHREIEAIAHHIGVELIAYHAMQYHDPRVIFRELLQLIAIEVFTVCYLYLIVLRNERKQK